MACINYGLPGEGFPLWDLELGKNVYFELFCFVNWCTGSYNSFIAMPGPGHNITIFNPQLTRSDLIEN